MSPRVDRGLGARLRRNHGVGEVKQQCWLIIIIHYEEDRDYGELLPKSGCLRISGNWRVRCGSQPHFLKGCFSFGFYEARCRLTATHGHWKVVEIIYMATEISSKQNLNLGNTNQMTQHMFRNITYVHNTHGYRPRVK